MSAQDLKRVHRRYVTGPLALGNTDTALDRLAGLGEAKYRWGNNRLDLERDSLFDLMRNEPAFIALLDDYRKNADEQPKLLQAMNDDPSG